jgi:hypothetical protein
MAILNEIMLLVEKYPNNMQLGEKVREIYWRERGLNEVVTHPGQMKMFNDDELLGGSDKDIDNVVNLGYD